MLDLDVDSDRGTCIVNLNSVFFLNYNDYMINAA